MKLKTLTSYEQKMSLRMSQEFKRVINLKSTLTSKKIFEESDEGYRMSRKAI